MNFQMNPQSLGALNSVPVDMTLQALDWQQRAQQADQMSLAEMNAANQRAAQKHMLDQEQARIANETSLAQLPGIRAQSSIQQRKNTMEEATFEPELKAKMTEFGIKATDAELKAYDQGVQKLLNSSNPAERARGEKLWQASSVMMKAREDHKLKMELDDRRANNDIRIKQAVPGTAAVPKADPTDIAAGAINALQSGRMDYVKGATTFYTLSELLPDTDPRKAQFRQIAEALEKARLADRTAGAKPAPDMAELGIPTTTPQANPALGGTANPVTADRPARQANSERVTIYKDGKAVGTVPKAQADQAVQEGYTLK
jgi:hypothetical protein